MPQRVTLTTRKALKITGCVPSGDCSVNCPKIPDQAAACIDVDLLGGLRVRAGQTTMGPRDLGGTKLRRVLLALILHRGAPVSKDRLVSMLWEGSPPSGAKATLETYVCVLRKTLQPDVSAVDALPMLQQAMALAGSPMLPEELDCEWLDDFRRVHDQNVRKGLIAAAVKTTGLPSGGAEQWARRALEGDPLDESAWHALLQSMENSGQHAAGLRAYDRCRRLFVEELGCTPGSGLQALYVRLLRGANEDNRELSQLFEALVRVHAATQTNAHPPARTLLGGRRDANEQASSVHQACRALELLLSSVRGGRQYIAGGIGT